MEDKLVTLAVHTNQKAQILKTVLEQENIDVIIESIDPLQLSSVSAGVKIRIKEVDLPRALFIVENRKLFSYDEEDTYRVDDGKKRILVPVDFSEYSLQACKIAFKIAKDFDAKVKIFHVYYNPYFPIDTPMADVFYRDSEDDGQSTNIIDKVKESMQKFCTEIDNKINTGEFPSINYSYSLREGIAEEEIATYTKSYKPSLIVMGAKGRHNNERHLLGGVTAEVIEMVNVPVLAIPKNSLLTSVIKPSHIAFCTTFNQRDLISFDVIARFAETVSSDLKITLTHIIEKKSDAIMLSEDKILKIKEYFTNRYPKLNIGYKLIDGSDDMFDNMCKFIEDEKVEIVALNTRRRNVFVRMFVPSVSRKILARSNASLFVLRG